jgi:hypothetical protein
MQGFYIKELRVKGIGVEDAAIVLEKGLNLINGPSNTGKSYIFNCIDYMFGADSLKKITESKGYERIYMEIRNFETDTPITLLRYIDKKDTFYALSEISKFDSAEQIRLKTNHDANKEDNISKFLLKQIGITENKILLSNKNGVKKTLGYRAIVNLSMISETKIISDTHSPVFNKIKTDETYCKSVFRYLLTMVEDITCEEIEKADIRKAKMQSKIEYINGEILNLIDEQKKLVKELDNDFSKEHIDINEYKDETSRIEKVIEDKRKLINNKKGLQDKLNQEKNQLSLLIDKFSILQNQYVSDLQRLTFLQDGEDCLKQIRFNHCPICNSEVDVKAFNEEYSIEVLDAAKEEEIKIKMHLLELDKTIKTTKNELKFIDSKNQQYKLDISINKKEIDELIANDLTPLKSVLMSFVEQSNINFRVKDIENRITSKKREVIGFIETKNQKQPKLNYNSSIPKETINEFTDEIGKTLTDWGFEDLINVTFDESDQDIIINGQTRKSNGKGYRAFFYAAFSVSLMNYLLSKKQPYTRILLLDSPITTLKENELNNGIAAGDDIIDTSMQDSLFISLSKSSDNKQIIILENKDLPEQINNCNHISFTKGKLKGRYGFFPQNQ